MAKQSKAMDMTTGSPLKLLVVFAIPMLLDEKTDAFTAMGTSISLCWNNLAVMLAWGAIVATLFALRVATGLLADTKALFDIIGQHLLEITGNISPAQGCSLAPIDKDRGGGCFAGSGQ